MTEQEKDELWEECKRLAIQPEGSLSAEDQKRLDELTALFEVTEDAS